MRFLPYVVVVIFSNFYFLMPLFAQTHGDEIFMYPTQVPVMIDPEMPQGLSWKTAESKAGVENYDVASVGFLLPDLLPQMAAYFYFAAFLFSVILIIWLLYRPEKPKK